MKTVGFQIEICRVQGLDVYALVFRRMNGYIWAYKDIIVALTKSLEPILSPPGTANASIAAAAAAQYAEDDNEVTDWWKVLNAAPAEPVQKTVPIEKATVIARKRSLPNNDELNDLVDWRAILKSNPATANT